MVVDWIQKIKIAIDIDNHFREQMYLITPTFIASLDNIKRDLIHWLMDPKQSLVLHVTN